MVYYMCIIELSLGLCSQDFLLFSCFVICVFSSPFQVILPLLYNIVWPTGIYSFLLPLLFAGTIILASCFVSMLCYRIYIRTYGYCLYYISAIDWQSYLKNNFSFNHKKKKNPFEKSVTPRIKKYAYIHVYLYKGVPGHSITYATRYDSFVFFVVCLSIYLISNKKYNNKKQLLYNSINMVQRLSYKYHIGIKMYVDCLLYTNKY